MENKIKRYNELFEKQYEQGLRLTNSETLEFWSLSYELAEEDSKRAWNEMLESGDYRM